MKPSLTIGLFLGLMTLGLADQLALTPEQRMEQRDAVVEAEVTSVKEIKKGEVDVNLYSAVLKIDKVLKSHPEITRPEVTVFFKMSPRGIRRCPPFAELKEKMRGTFYLRYADYLTGAKGFLVETGSDVVTR